MYNEIILEVVLSKSLKPKQLSNPISTGGGGTNFENEVQSSFILLMLSKGIFNPLGNNAIIEKIDFQARIKGYELDDIVVHAKSTLSNTPYKMLTQIKRNISIQKSDDDFREVIKAAWDDFNNTAQFNKNRDLLALITSALSANDCDAIYFILEQAQAVNNFQEFYDRINKTNFSSTNKIQKFKVIENLLTEANDNNAVSQEQVWEFCKCFRIFIYDLHIKGICSSLLYTIIELQSPNNSHSIWCQIKEYASRINARAATVEISDIPEEITTYFNNKNIDNPFHQINKPVPVVRSPINNFNRDILLLFLLGSFDENNNDDVELIKKFIRTNYRDWISSIRNIIQDDNAPIFLKNGIWGIKNKQEIFKNIKTCIYDEDIDALNELSITVFQEIDPQYELNKEQRYCASLYNKCCKYSSFLRSGLADTLAFIGVYQKEIKNCSKNKINNNIIDILRMVFKNSSWQLWASLSDYLSMFAEASPREFLSILNNEDENVFKELYAQEGDGLTGRNYMLGILKALETLAWDKKYLSEVTLLLGYLSTIDPGGNYGNRPIHSLKEIFIPWHVQTFATIDEQKNAIKCLNNDHPKIAWDVLISILPDEHQCAVGITKPQYRNSVPKDWKYRITNKQYYDISLYYANFLIEQSRYNIEKLQKLVDIIPKMPDDLFNKIVNYLSEQEIIESSDNKKYQLWNELKTLVNHHIKYSECNWAMDSSRIKNLKKVIRDLEPRSIVYRSIRLFSNAALMDYELSKKIKENNSNYMKGLRRIQCKQIKEIVNRIPSAKCILMLIRKVENLYDLGFTVGKINSVNFDSNFLPKYLITKKQKESMFIAGYIDARFHYKNSKYIKNNFNWVKNINTSNWSKNQISKLYQYLPINTKTIKMVEELDSDIKNDYWQNVKINPYAIKDIIDEVINKMVIYGRKNTAIECLYYNYHTFKNQEDIDFNKIIEVLMMSESIIEPSSKLDSYYTVTLIEILQKNKQIDKSKLVNIEWIYLNLLNEYDGHSPITLNAELATNPSMFCEMIQLIYKSDKTPEISVNKDKQKMAEHAWKLLQRWKKVPGTLDDGTYDFNQFTEWFNFVTKELKKSGHYKVAIYNIGEILYYTPKDIDGFWINKGIAALLNKKDHEDMRHGFYIKTRNSRGVHWVDPEAKPEKELEAKYNALANETEAQGFARLATLLKELADSYAKDAQRIIEEQKYIRELS